MNTNADTSFNDETLWDLATLNTEEGPTYLPRFRYAEGYSKASTKAEAREVYEKAEAEMTARDFNAEEQGVSGYQIWADYCRKSDALGS